MSATTGPQEIQTWPGPSPEAGLPALHYESVECVIEYGVPIDRSTSPSRH